jgi:hypothetical protein
MLITSCATRSWAGREQPGNGEGVVIVAGHPGRRARASGEDGRYGTKLAAGPLPAKYPDMTLWWPRGFLPVTSESPGAYGRNQLEHQVSPAQTRLAGSGPVQGAVADSAAVRQSEPQRTRDSDWSA